MPNQKDVAKLAGVSSASVSRYLTNSNLVSQEKAEKIQKAIETLNYKVDTAAQTLKTGKTHHVSILVPGSAPFYWVTIQGIQQRLSKAGYYSSSLFTRQVTPDLPYNPHLLHRLINSNNIEAFIHFPLNSEEDTLLSNRIKKLHKNVLIIDKTSENSEIPCIIFDNYGAGRYAAKEIVKKGHTKIALLQGDAIFQSSIDRSQGFIDGLVEEGIFLQKDAIIQTSYTAEVAYPLFLKMKLPEFTAILAPNDTTSIAFLKAAKKRGICCPKDFELISFDNNIEYTPYTTPSISSFDQPVLEAGIKAAEYVLKMIEGKDVPPTTILPLTLVRRESFS